MTETEIMLHDNQNERAIIADFGNQIVEAVDIGNNTIVPDNYKNINKIIIAGLGGSAIGGDLLRSVLHYECKVPIYINRNYFLPEFADEKTLVIISSYSGGTEESLSAYEDAIKRKCKIVCISSGGKLSLFAESNGNLIIKVPGGLQPRCALGYSFFPMLILMTKLGLAEDKSMQYQNIINNIKSRSRTYMELDEKNNQALNIAALLKGKIPVIYSSNDLLDIVNLRWRCQVNENAKSLAFGNLLSEMNHNEIVGWQNNPELLKNFAVISLVDSEDNPRLLTRMKITLDIIKGLSALEIQLSGEGGTKLERIFDLIYLGDWMSYYLAILYKVDPTPIEKINILKNKLAEN